jgi:dephospho-CoA kinase
MRIKRAGAGMSEQRVVGLTGGIAAGKSVVAGFLRDLGAPVVDADAIAHELTAPGTPLVARIAEAFGPDVLASGDRLLRDRLAARVFRDPEARRRLEGITHPAIMAEARRRVVEYQHAGHAVVVYEAALIVETGRHHAFDLLVVVRADHAVRMQRLRQRDGLTAEQARQRLASQLPQEAKERVADYVIDNSGALEETRIRTVALWEQLNT